MPEDYRRWQLSTYMRLLPRCQTQLTPPLGGVSIGDHLYGLVSNIAR